MKIIYPSPIFKGVFVTFASLVTLVINVTDESLFHSMLLQVGSEIFLAGAATELVHIFGKRDCNDLERLSHRGVNVNHIDEIISSGTEAYGHGSLMNHFTGIDSKHRDTHYAARWAFEDHLDDPASVTDSSCSWHYIE